MITVTDRAVQAIRESIAQENQSVADSYLRVSVKGGGCSGMMYDLSIETAMRDGDEILERNDVRIVVDPKSKLFLHGMTLDFTTGLNGKGFVFSNPNATGTCGCGESFSA